MHHKGLVHLAVVFRFHGVLGQNVSERQEVINIRLVRSPVPGCTDVNYACRGDVCIAQSIQGFFLA